VSIQLATSDPSADRLVPLYVRIQRRIRNGIATGAHGACDRLPSESELASEFRTTRATVRHALSQLVFEGLIVRHVGRGSFVSDRTVIRSPIDARRCLTFEEQVALTGRIVTYRSPSFELIAAPRDVTEKLRIKVNAEIFRLERLRIIDRRPVCLERRYLPRDIGKHVTGEMLAQRPAHEFVGEILGERIPTIVVSITAEIAGGRVAELLDVPEGSALIIRDNTHHASTGAPVLCGRSIFPGDVCTDYVLGQELPPAAEPLPSGDP
jgi:GntR family transcriptional regulator